MRNYVLVIFLLVASISVAVAGDFVSIGFGTIATPTLSLGLSSRTIVGTMPSGVSKLTVFAIGGDINYGGSDVASGSNAAYIASGSSKDFDDLGVRNPRIYLTGRSGSATAVLVAK